MGFIRDILNDYYDSLTEPEQYYHGVPLSELNSIAKEARGKGAKLLSYGELRLIRKSNRNKDVYIVIEYDHGRIHHRAISYQGYPDHVADSFVSLVNTRCSFTN